MFGFVSSLLQRDYIGICVCVELHLWVKCKIDVTP
jgi:hypothetical protein